MLLEAMGVPFGGSRMCFDVGVLIWGLECIRDSGGVFPGVWMLVDVVRGCGGPFWGSRMCFTLWESLLGGLECIIDNVGVFPRVWTLVDSCGWAVVAVGGSGGVYYGGGEFRRGFDGVGLIGGVEGLWG